MADRASFGSHARARPLAQELPQAGRKIDHARESSQGWPQRRSACELQARGAGRLLSSAFSFPPGRPVDPDHGLPRNKRHYPAASAREVALACVEALIDKRPGEAI